MSLIDKDKTLDAISMYLFVNDAIRNDVKVGDYRVFAKSMICDVPEVDLVRCKECKSWKWIEWAKEYRCTLRNTAFNARADDFCSYGEREGE